MDRSQSSNKRSKPNRRSGHICSIIPPYLLEALAESDTATPDAHARTAAQDTLATTDMHKRKRLMKSHYVTSHPTISPTTTTRMLHREVYDGGKTTRLQASPARCDIQGPASSQDVAVNECYDGFTRTSDFLWEIFDLNSLDGKGHRLIGTVHYGENFGNALWNGDEMVFGDGDSYFKGFTMCVDIIAHELAHGVTMHLSGLNYHGESGALNESISDVFGAMVKQHYLNQQSVDADWLIGEGLFINPAHGFAIRSMKAPGTAFDLTPDSKLPNPEPDSTPLNDPQPAHYDQFHVTDDDNGGVHINSGIPNHAFYLVAVGLGGYSWEEAGRIWYHALRGLKPTADFEMFANCTVDKAQKLYPENVSIAKVVKDAWKTVGVLPETSFKRIFQTKSGVPGYNLKASVDLIFAFDYEHNGKMDHLALYRPGKGIFSIVKGVEVKGDDMMKKFEFQEVLSSKDEIGGFDLKKSADRALAFDYDHSGKLDHIVFYRPGTGRISILKNTAGTFEPVYESTRDGIGGFDLSDPLDRIIAFDFEGSGKLDHLVLYRRGSGDACIVKNKGGVFSDVYSNSEGIGGYNLQSRDDRIVAFDYNQSGKRDHLTLYRRGSGIIWILRKAQSEFTPVYQQGVPASGEDKEGEGIGGYDLSSPSDRLIAFDNAGSGMADHFVLYRPGTGAVRILKRSGNDFTPVYKQNVGGKGIGGFDLKQSNDTVLAFDLESTGVANNLVLYRPGKGELSVLKGEE